MQPGFKKEAVLRGLPPLGAIIVMGVSGSGKSTLGRLLAAELACAFIEGDELHDAANVAKMRSGQPLVDADRWPWLDRLGSALAKEIAAHGVAVAACSALRFRYRERLCRAIAAPVSFIMLDASATELEQRLKRRAGHFMPSSLLASQLATLERPRDHEHALILDASQPSALLCKASRDWLLSEASQG
ncbi:MAG TPA: gluconokinase [Sphingobium sp.]|nr:gluconokinase [Sphingobium sp.]